MIFTSYRPRLLGWSSSQPRRVRRVPTPTTATADYDHRYRSRRYEPPWHRKPQLIRSAGWALTLLSEENLSYASTCQTIGLTTGYFASFTVFLALNSEAFAYVIRIWFPPYSDVPFSNKWGIPRLTMDAYLRFWGLACYSVTGWLFFVKEVCLWMRH